MPKARHLAPWHQADVIEALEGGDEESSELTARQLEALKGKPAISHPISRVLD